MKIKEKLSQGWEYTKAHPGRVIGGTLAAAGVVFGGTKLVHLIVKSGKSITVSHSAEKMLRPMQHSIINLGDVGRMDDFWIDAIGDNNFPTAIINNVKLQNMGVLGEKLIEGSNGVIDPAKDVSMMIGFNCLPK